VLAAAHGLGLSLPRDCSIAGFGDDALAGYVWPPLTTIRQPTRALAWQAADLLLGPEEMIAYREQPFELIVRASTAPLSR
jgi:LacI family transcriptional regulator